MKWYRLVPVMLVGVLFLGSAMVQPALAQLKDSEPGSFLVFPLFDVTTGNSTKIRITNNGAASRDVRVLWVCPGTASQNGTFSPNCDSLDQKFTLTSHATIVKDVATQLFPSCNAGFIVAFAQDTTGRPVSWNALTGSYQVIYGPPANAGDTTTEAAEAIVIQAAQPALSILGTDDGFLNLSLQFGTPVAPATQVDYQALPGALLGDFAAIGGALTPPALVSPATTPSETDTRIILLTLSIFAGATNHTARASINTWDQIENGPFSASRDFICWDRFGGSASGSSSTALKKLPNGPLTTDYGSLRITFNAGGNNAGTYNPAGLGAIEEVSALTAAATTRGNTIRNMFHQMSKSSTFVTDVEITPPTP